MEKITRSQENVEAAIALYIAGSHTAVEALTTGGLTLNDRNIAEMSTLLSAVAADVAAAWESDTSDSDECEDADNLIADAATELIAIDDETNAD